MEQEREDKKKREAELEKLRKQQELKEKEDAVIRVCTALVAMVTEHFTYRETL